MPTEKSNAADAVGGARMVDGGVREQAHASGFYEVECRDADGNLKWRDTVLNLVTTPGGDGMLDAWLGGSNYTAAWYLGLVDGAAAPAFALTDTMAAHAGWTENTSYSETARQTAAWNAAAGKSKSLSSGVTFTANAAATIAGCFLANDATKGGTTGLLYSAGAFTGGNKVLANGDKVTVTYTATV